MVYRLAIKLLGIVLISASPGAARISAAEIRVYAAASLRESLKAIAANYEAQTGDKITFNFAASSFLARQIEEGAPADLFFSADEARMDGLEKKGLIVKETRQTRLSNSLVIVVRIDSELRLASAKDLGGARIRRLALADPRTVPAGIYAKAYLQSLMIWSLLEAKVVPTDNVRAALSAVESGNVEAGIVYKTDAAISKKVKIAFQIPVEEGPAISYPMAVLKEAREPDGAKRFLQYLGGPEAGTVFAKHGFILTRA